ncbi:MAG: sulfotransferase [bacterium]
MRQQKIIFICGLHRSGTTLLTRILSTHSEISGFSGTGVSMDEGQHLQSILPADYHLGGPGRFAFHKYGHLIDNGFFSNPQNPEILMAEWGKHWDLSKKFLLEKSPPNLIRARLLQRFFPNAQFVFIVRHPVASSYATIKFKKGLPFIYILWHWVVSHEFMLNDLHYLKNYYILHYEKLVSDPESCLNKIGNFLNLSHTQFNYNLNQIDNMVNIKYFNKWSTFSVFSKKCMQLLFEKRCRIFGYSLKNLHHYESINLNKKPKQLDYYLGKLINSGLLLIKR